MASINKPTQTYTHENGKAKIVSLEEQLRRSVMTCMLWEDTFYEDGINIYDRITDLANKVNPKDVFQIMMDAKFNSKLRHIPLLLARILAKRDSISAIHLEKIITRPDDITEFLALYWKEGKEPLSKQVKLGIAWAFNKFDEYQLAKYNRKKKIKLKDALILCHPKPKDEAQSDLWKRLIEDRLKTPNTWEVGLSTNKDKKSVWENLIRENKLSALAFLRNIRNMVNASVDIGLIKQGLKSINTEKILPFQFILPAKFVPQIEGDIEEIMLKSIPDIKLDKKIILLIDVSGSMYNPLSFKSELERIDVACGLAILTREVCNDLRIFTFSEQIVEIPPRKGFALRDAIINSQSHGNTYLGLAVAELNNFDYDILIVLTDEQSHDSVPDPKNKGYMINIATYDRGVGYGKWFHINGWSEKIIEFIAKNENDR